MNLKLRRIMQWSAALAVLGLVIPCMGEGGLALAGEDDAVAATPRGHRSAKRQSAETKRKKKPRRKQASRTKVCQTRNGKRRCTWVTSFSGHGVAAASLRAEPLPRPSGEIWVYSTNFREEIKVNIYGPDGELDEDALATLDESFRCRRSGESRAVDPRLYELLSVIYDHFGQRRIELVSGFRNQRNEGSRHYHASAMDIRIPGVSTTVLYNFASSLDTGGLGIGRYPTSDFVHIDFRAPGEKSYRWIDHSGPEGEGKAPKARKRKRQNNT
jgi:uncharacterized protein YcbK (DUF882 family)